MESIGLIAATGVLPLHVGHQAVRLGHTLVTICLKGFTDPAIENVAGEKFWLKLGQIDKAIAIFKSYGIQRIIMAGKIEKANMMKPWNLLPDRRCLRLVRSLDDWRDDTVLAALAAEFAKDGIVVDEITRWASDLMAPLGVLTSKTPTPKQWADIEFGRKMALGIGALDIGQTVVIKSAAVICAEAIEGTDKAILRAGELAIPGAVVVKMAKPCQDMRFDVPAVGPTTIASMVKAGAKVLAVEAGKTMLADAAETLAAAEAAKIVVVGLPATGPLPL